MTEVTVRDTFGIDPYTGNPTETITKETFPDIPYVPHARQSKSKPPWGLTTAILTLLAIVVIIIILILVFIPRSQKDGYTILERFERNRQLRRDQRNKEEFRKKMKKNKKKNT